MSSRCTNPECGYPDTPCFRRAEFGDGGEGCPDRGATQAPPPTPGPAAPAPRPPSRFWSGHALGSQDVFHLLADNPPRFVAIAGREDAGKTCLLVAQYLQIAQGRAPGVRFCGSKTLRGWDQLASAAWEWTGEASRRIVPRTSLGSHREPGLLHYAFKRRVGGDSRAVHPRVEELVLTDYPGEWFKSWTERADYAQEMPWLRRVDVFWVVVDAPRLNLDSRAGRDARNLLSKVLSEARDGRPVALILTQVHRVAPSGAESDLPERVGKHLAALREQLAQHPGPQSVFLVSAFPARPGDAPPQGVLDPLRFALDAPLPRPSLPPREVHSDRMFRHFREATP